MICSEENEMVKKITVIILVLLAAAGIVYWGLQPHSVGGSGYEENLDNEGTNYFVDGWCEHDAGARLEYSPCEIECTYKGTFNKGTLIITICDEYDNVLYKTTITESGEYDETITVKCTGDWYHAYFRYEEGSSGFFEYMGTQYVSNFRYLFSIGERSAF